MDKEEMSVEDIAWAEEFYAELEAHCADYERPIDYLDRAHRVLTKPNKRVSNQYEGRSGYLLDF